MTSKWSVSSTDSDDIDEEYKAEWRRLCFGESDEGEKETYSVKQRRKKKEEYRNSVVGRRKRVLKNQVGRTDLSREGGYGNKQAKQCAKCGWLGIKAHWSKHWQDYHPGYPVSHRL